MNGPLIDPMTGTLAAVEHAAAQPQARTKEAFMAALAMLSPELQAQFFSRVNKEARKCGLPTCEQMTLHRGGYCCKEHKAEHKLRLRVRDRKVKIYWRCHHKVTDQETGHPIVCEHDFYTMEDRSAAETGNLLAVCPDCFGELSGKDHWIVIENDQYGRIA